MYYFWLQCIYFMYMVFHISAAEVLICTQYIVIYALCTHISCTKLPPSYQLNGPLPCDKAILVATAAFLLCRSCMGTLAILYTKSRGVVVMVGASSTNY